MYKNEFVEIIGKILNGSIDRQLLGQYLMDFFDYEAIYDSDDEMVTDIFFALKHFASGEEDISDIEWTYFLDCLLEKRKYNIDEKTIIIAVPQE